MFIQDCEDNCNEMFYQRTSNFETSLSTDIYGIDNPSHKQCNLQKKSALQKQSEH